MRWMLILVVLLTVACGGSSNGDSDKASVTPDDVIAAFQSAGLEADSPTPMTKDDYGMAPMVGDGVRFLIPSLGANMGGRVIVVPDKSERERLVAYYTDLGKQSAAFASHVFQSGDVVVQINGDLPDDQAAQYQDALNGMSEEP